MSAHIIINIEVENPADLAPYQELARPTMQEHGIKLVNKTPAATVLEGETNGKMLVLLEADSLETAKTWYASSGYKKAIQAREGVAKFTTQIV